MNKPIKLFLALSLFFGNFTSSIFSASASENTNGEALYFTDERPAESYLNSVPDVSLDYGDSFINKEALQVGIDYQNMKNARRLNEEVWTFVSSEPYKAYGDLQGDYLQKIGAQQGSQSSATFSLNLSFVTKYGITLDGNIGWSCSYTKSGPSGTEAVGSNYATHTYYVGIASGAITKYVYKITDKYTGEIIDEDRVVYLAHDKKSTVYGILGCYNASTDMLTIRSVYNSGTKTKDEDDIIAVWNGTNPMSYIGF